MNRISGLTTDRKAEYRGVVMRLLIEGKAELYAQRAKRRHPPYPRTNQTPHIDKINALRLTESVAKVEKSYAAQTILLINGKQEFRVEHHRLFAADHIGTATHRWS